MIFAISPTGITIVRSNMVAKTSFFPSINRSSVSRTLIALCLINAGLMVVFFRGSTNPGVLGGNLPEVTRLQVILPDNPQDELIIPYSPLPLHILQQTHDPRPVINPHPFKYVHNQEKACSPHSDLFLLTVVHSSPERYKHRMVIRNTWGNPSLYAEIKTIVLFFMGISKSRRVQNAVALESERYQDIIQEGFIDSYRNITYKGVMWLKWSSLYCQNPAFTLKIDDDVVVHIFRLVRHLYALYKHGSVQNRTVLCRYWETGLMPVKRNRKSKWYISKDDYPNDWFSQYCAGAAYVISKDLMYPMYEKSLYTKFFWVDDFYMTGLLLRDLNVTYHNLAPLYSIMERREDQERLALERNVIFLHAPSSSRKRYRLWNELKPRRNDI